MLDRGEFFGIYPEGTRSRDGLLHRGHTGAARLALRTGAPLIPVGIRGTDRVQPTGAKAPRPFTSCQVNIGEPIDVTRYLDRQNDRMLLRQLTDEVMFAVRTLSGQEYVDSYAGKTKADAAEQQPVPDPSTPSEPPPHVDPAVPEPAARELVLPDGSVAHDDDSTVIDVRASSADVLSKWWS